MEEKKNTEIVICRFSLDDFGRKRLGLLLMLLVHFSYNEAIMVLNAELYCVVIWTVFGHYL